MCGIAGFSGRFEPELLPRMGAAIAHRGPDDVGNFFDVSAGIGLVHRRLSILDLSPLGHQPMSDPTGRVTIVFNGEIYNFRELRRELESRGVVFRSHSDTEVLIHLYLERGDAFLTALNGIFGIALWDRESRRLVVARDGLGVIPLYVGQTPRGLVFASEMKALLQAEDLSLELDPHALAAYVSLLWCPSPRTPLATVKKLEPGVALEVRGGMVSRSWQFYELPYGEPRARLSTAAAATHVREVIRSAVHRQLVSDVPVGAFLSGGLDSSAVVAFAREVTPKLPCFTIGLELGASEGEGFADDLPYAKKVAAALGVELAVVQVGEEMADHLRDMVWALDEPQADMAPLNALFIARLARANGIKVLLSGAGGDDVFTGYRRHAALSVDRFWEAVPPHARGALARSARMIPPRLPLLRRVRKLVGGVAGDADDRLIRMFEWVPREDASALLAPELRARVGAESPLATSLERCPPGATRLERMLFLEAKHFLADHNLPYTNKMGMAAGVEVRVPLLDKEVVAAAARLPDGYKQHGPTGKWIFRKAMEPLLPRDVIYRPKTGFGVPLRRWLRGPLAGLVRETLSEDRLRRRGIFDPSRVRALVDRDAAGHEDAAHSILALVCVELWASLFIGRP